MNAQVTPEIQPFVAVIHGEIKTTSLKIAEHFNKRHGDVLHAIDDILTQVTDSFKESNFTPLEYEQKNSLGKMVKYRYFEMTKDGFTLIALSFTGKKAVKWKVAYINAFNAMAEQLHQHRLANQSNQLPEPPTISNAQQGILLNLINDKSRATGKLNSYYLSRLKSHFNLSSYKYLPADRIDEAYEFLRKLDSGAEDALVMLSQKELNALIDKNQFSKKDDDIIAKENSITLTLSLKPWTQGDKLQRWLITKCQDLLTYSPLNEDQEVMNKETFIRILQHDDYIVMKKSEFFSRFQD